MERHEAEEVLRGVRNVDYLREGKANKRTNLLTRRTRVEPRPPSSTLTPLALSASATGGRFASQSCAMYSLACCIVPTFGQRQRGKTATWHEAEGLTHRALQLAGLLSLAQCRTTRQGPWLIPIPLHSKLARKHSDRSELL